MKNNYTGELLDDLPHGYGLLRGTNYEFDGELYDFIYVGQFNNGKKHGTGILNLLSDWVKVEELVLSFDLKRDPRQEAKHQLIGQFNNDIFTGEGLIFTHYNENIYHYENGNRRLKIR